MNHNEEIQNILADFALKLSKIDQLIIKGGITGVDAGKIINDDIARIANQIERLTERAKI